jgi:hypothetical protein
MTDLLEVDSGAVTAADCLSQLLLGVVTGDYSMTDIFQQHKPQNAIHNLFVH